ncbi:MAG: hypothetical protein LVQ95_03540 [Candidatus Micrarchaeales archaeon]|nr:hypothetical protein [Candidatus Micrarchaeales archaeon]
MAERDKGKAGTTKASVPPDELAQRSVLATLQEHRINSMTSSSDFERLVADELRRLRRKSKSDLRLIQLDLEEREAAIKELFDRRAKAQTGTAPTK